MQVGARLTQHELARSRRMLLADVTKVAERDFPEMYAEPVQFHRHGTAAPIMGPSKGLRVL